MSLDLKIYFLEELQDPEMVKASGLNLPLGTNAKAIPALERGIWQTCVADVANCVPVGIVLKVTAPCAMHCK